MTPAQDRQHIAALIDEATAAGASLAAACAVLDLSPRTLQRWQDPSGGICEDRRPDAARPAPRNKLSEAERDEIVATCNAPEFASLPPSQIVPCLADQGKYIASESSMYRVLKERRQNLRRGRAPPQAGRSRLRASRQRGPARSGPGISPGCLGQWLAPSSTSISSSTSSAGRSLAGRSTNGRQQSSQRRYSSVLSGRRAASQARWCCMRIMAAP